MKQAKMMTIIAVAFAMKAMTAVASAEGPHWLVEDGKNWKQENSRKPLGPI